MRKKDKIVWTIILAIILAALICLAYLIYVKVIALPALQKAERIVFPKDQWESTEVVHGFNHLDQGSSILPHDWFMALEPPGIGPFFGDSEKRYVHQDYLGRVGFLYEDQQHIPKDSPFAGLPIGFSRGRFVDAYNGQQREFVGLTCAACHTGMRLYKGVGIQVDGGPAMIDVTKFGVSFALSLVTTYYLPWRWDRFAARFPDVDNDDLRKNFYYYLDSYVWSSVKSTIARWRSGQSSGSATAEGTGRMDALARIGNAAFDEAMGNPHNNVSTNAPVKYPRLWGLPWQEVVQYNGSVAIPMVRNVGEVLGVYADVKLRRDPDKPFASEQAALYDSSVRLCNLFLVEQILKGEVTANMSTATADQIKQAECTAVIPGMKAEQQSNEKTAEPFLSGLRAPQWPAEILGALDEDKKERGSQLYQARCQGCHLPSENVLREEYAKPDSGYWTKADSQGRRFVKLVTKNIAVIGTDPNQAMNWNRRLVDTTDLNKGQLPASTALYEVIKATVKKEYQRLNLDKETQNQWNGRDKTDHDVTDELHYVAPTLSGVWATAPYLHNGSVPNLYQVLSPVAERDKKFYLGRLDFDPVKLGLSTQAYDYGFELDTSLDGNTNTGHEFRALTDEEIANDKNHTNNRPKGVIGAALSHDEKMALIEYLKSF